MSTSLLDERKGTLLGSRKNCNGIAGTRGTNRKTAGKEFPAVFPGVTYPGWSVARRFAG
jgi:hypothetical protein